MSGVLLRAIAEIAILDERDRCAAILRKVPEARAPQLEPWWRWSA